MFARQTRRFMTDEAHAMSCETQVSMVRRNAQEFIGRRENLSPGDAGTDWFARPLLDLFDQAEKVNKFGVRFTQNPHSAQITDVAFISSSGIKRHDIAGLQPLV